jgi:hypothetical protein
MLRKATYREYYASFDPAFQLEDERLVNQLGKTIPYPFRLLVLSSTTPRLE